MPGRATPLVTEEIYHVFNRGIDYRLIFDQKKDYSRTITTLDYYRYVSPPIRLSYFLQRPHDEKEQIKRYLSGLPKYVELLSYCLMPNHFHLLLRQTSDRGISKYMANTQNSYSKYYDAKYERQGRLFMGQFKAVHIISDEQLLHVSRYIHLNPYTSSVVKSLEDVWSYPWSSISEYLLLRPTLCDTTLILNYFQHKRTYKDFLSDQADYQRKLHNMKHLVFE